MEAALLKQIHEIKEQIRDFCERQDQLAKEAVQTDKEWEKVSNLVMDLLDQGAELRVEIGRMELELEQLKEENERMQWEVSGLGGTGQVADFSVSGGSGYFSWTKGTQKEKG